MAEIHAFRGWRYNKELADPGLVTAPPYDVIDPRGQDYYYRRHPENVIRLILGREEAGDNERANKYTRARGYLDDWRRRGVLVHENTPAVYLYRQDFQVPEGGRAARSGLIADLALSPFGEGVVRPHERTLSKPKEDRLRLMRATGFQLSQIFMLYEDPDGALRASLEVRPEEPAADLIDPEGVRHRLWPLTEAGTIDRLRSFFAPRPVYIADGHHRYETALAYRDELQRRGLPLGDAGRVAVVLVDLDQPGLVVFPTHRAVHALASWDEGAFRRRLEEFFRLVPYEGSPRDLARDVAKQPHAFGFVFRDASYKAILADEAAAMAAMPQERAPAWRRLDVSLLHSLVLGRILGLDDEAQAKQTNLIYTREADEAAAMTVDGRAQFSVLLGPTPVRQVKDVADAGETMPQKSTYFWPKLLSGLVLKEL
ncbi:MAG: DUF1015 domain-containing protein [Bacteroidota bacterium]